MPLHTCNLQGRFGRNKRWDYWGILAGDLAISSTFSMRAWFGPVSQRASIAGSATIAVMVL